MSHSCNIIKIYLIIFYNLKINIAKMSAEDKESIVSKETKEIMVKLVTSLLTAKPMDPVPHIYSYLQEIKKGVDPNEIKPITDNELNELRNLEKKVEYLKDQLNDGHASQTESDEDSEGDVEDIQPKKKNIKQQRMGVSAEVYGTYNKKADFVAKVIPKSDATIE